MSYDNDRISFYTELSNAWGVTTPLRFDSIHSDDQITTGNAPWIHCNINHMGTQQKSLGTSNVLYQTLGSFDVDIYDREEKGFANILKYADTIRTLFIGKSLSSMTIRVISVSILKRENYKGWNSRRVLIHFESNEYTSRL